MGKSFIYYADSAFTVTYGKLRKHRNRNKCHDRIKNAVAVCDGAIVICIEKQCTYVKFANSVAVSTCLFA